MDTYDDGAAGALIDQVNREYAEVVEQLDAIRAVLNPPATGPMTPEAFVTLLQQDISPAMVGLIGDLGVMQPEPRVLLDNAIAYDAAGLALLAAGRAPTIRLLGVSA